MSKKLSLPLLLLIEDYKRELETAVQRKDLEAVKKVLGWGVEDDKTSDDKEKESKKEIRGAILTTASIYNSPEIIQLLLNCDTDVHHNQDFALCWAAWYGNTRVVDLLLKNGADVRSRNNRALREAMTNNHLDVVLLLLENGARYESINGDVVFNLFGRYPDSKEELIDMIKVCLIHQE